MNRTIRKKKTSTKYRKTTNILAAPLAWTSSIHRNRSIIILERLGKFANTSIQFWFDSGLRKIFLDFRTTPRYRSILIYDGKEFTVYIFFWSQTMQVNKKMTCLIFFINYTVHNPLLYSSSSLLIHFQRAGSVKKSLDLSTYGSPQEI